MTVKAVEVGGHRLGLVPGGGVWIDDARVLLVADVHLGKAETFASLGVPVPASANDATLARLSRMMEATGAACVIVLGDWLHGPRALDPAGLARMSAWRARHHATKIIVVVGNHDAGAGALPGALDIACVREPFPAPNRKGLWLAHHPGRIGTSNAEDCEVEKSDSGSIEPQRYLLAGHLHPAVRLKSRAGDSIRLPCWWFGRDYGVLPAFGEFTGALTIRRVRGDRVFATIGDAIREVPATTRSRTAK